MNKRSRNLGACWAVAALIAIATTAPADGEGRPWPEISPGEKALESVPGAPGAPAVVLYHRGELRVEELGKPHCVDLYRRVKVLTDEGRSIANLWVGQSTWWRLETLEARTHNADGSIVPLAARDVFEEAVGKRKKKLTQKTLALPQVEPGSIVEIRARQCFGGLLFALPWFFQEGIPTLRSELIIDRPKSFAVMPYRRIVPSHDLQEVVEDSGDRWRSSFVLEHLAGIPPEPMSFPFRDLASNLVVVSHEVALGSTAVPLLKSWSEAIDLFQGNSDYGYRSARRADGGAKARARGMTKGLEGERARAEVIYRFVRDEIDLVEAFSVSIVEDSVRQIHARKSGNPSEKAVVLQAMLDVVGIGSSIVWARSKWMGRTAEEIPNPWQFTHVLVAAEIDGQRVFLDPSDTALAFGAIAPSLEATKALLVDGREPEWVVLPSTSADDNRNRARVELAIEADGGVSGSVELLLTGQTAWEQLFPEISSNDRETTWSEALAEGFADFEVEDVTLAEDVDSKRIVVGCRLSLRPDARLEDEVSLDASAPFSLSLNPFTLEPEKRRSPVQFDFPWSEEVELVLSWPEGWTLDGEPLRAATTNEAGRYQVETDLDPQARRLRFARTLRLERAELIGREAYTQLYELFRQAQLADAEPLILVRR